MSVDLKSGFCCCLPWSLPIWFSVSYILCRPPCLSPTPRSLLKLVSTSQWCHPTLSPSVGTSLFIGLFSIVKIPTAKLSPQSSFGISHSKTASSCAALRVFKMLFIYWNCTLPRENGFSELTQSFFYVSTTSRSQDDAGILVISTVTSGQLGLLLSC